MTNDQTTEGDQTVIELKTGQDVLDLLANPHIIVVHQVVIHPDAARALLDLNTVNRAITASRIERLARILGEGRWLLINNGIAVDSNGDLLDGQHRLLAIIKTGIAAPFFLHVGLKPEARHVIDVGKTRSFADSLTIAGYGRGMTNRGAALSLLYRYENETLNPWANGGSKEAIAHDQLLDFSRTLNEGLMIQADLDASAMARTVRGLNRSAMTALLYCASVLDVFEAEAFATRVKYGEGLHNGDPELTMRNTVMRMVNDKRKPNDWHFIVYVKAWNARRAGKNMHAVRVAFGDEIPEVK